MKIAVLKERAPFETRVAITPDIAKAYIKAGFKVDIEKNAGLLSGFLDEEYVKAGAHVSGVPLEIVSDADIILKVQPTPASDDINELSFAREKAVIIGLLSPFANLPLIQNYAERKITALAMELVPRTTKAQSMDALSSQSNIAGYRAVIEAANYFGKAFPMMMTAAGTISPAKVLVLGAGVAGLQAIATAKRLGGAVSAYDVRAASKEQVESVGAKFISVAEVSGEGAGGYAKELAAEQQHKQSELLAEHAAKNDIIISTAQIPGKPAPKLITKEMVESMRAGSVLVDLATSTGGNIEGSKRDEVVKVGGVTIIGFSSLATHVPGDSSRLYAKNLYNLVMHAFKDGKLTINDEIVSAMMMTNGGKVL